MFFMFVVQFYLADIVLIGLPLDSYKKAIVSQTKRDFGFQNKKKLPFPEIGCTTS